MSGRPGLLIPVTLALLLAACSAPSTRVVLLPQEGGAPSAVVVRAKAGAGAETTVSQPYQRATAASGAGGAPRLDQADPAKVLAEHRSLFDMAPPRPQRYTLYFDAGGTVLTAESQLVLEQVLAAALARSGGDMVITGHTDTVGSGASNDALSAQRAQQVRQMLADRQFPAARIEAAGRGERELAVPTADEVDEPRNRRVTIEVR
ncbi:outer membrane protein/peptidoglycan-associated lipoprotein [Polaromonas sp. CF318]|uniref:OmpA family protein n=1 Tax=Polaromonas sp. CF318 TaxID=1144318 RepID=UPI0002711012|nr:OmpA family protein [Polaromonas sp. CF318]EJL84936.1 outer membrane protein/peptidoglycan-associated lipoprotein [Polaromonas sp. CF318]